MRLRPIYPIARAAGETRTLRPAASPRIASRSADDLAQLPDVGAGHDDAAHVPGGEGEDGGRGEGGGGQRARRALPPEQAAQAEQGERPEDQGGAEV